MGLELIIVFAVIVIAFMAFCVWLLAIHSFVEVVKMKGHHQEGATTLWLIGLFASPIVLGLYAAALPDRNATVATKAAAPNPADELPAI